MKRVTSIALALICMVAGSLRADDELEKKASWSIPDATAVKKQLDGWLKDREADELTLAKVDALWTIKKDAADTPQQRLQRLCECFAVVDKRAAELIKVTSDAPKTFAAPKIEFAEEDEKDTFLTQNVRLLYGCWLAQHDLYDEAMEQIAELSVDQVVDPSSLLFYRSAGNHRLLKKEQCLEDITLLLENEQIIPRRFSTVAKLMEADMKPLKPDTLDEVARLMDDIKRRLRLARAGKRVRDEEDEVIKKLDKMIEEAEKQQQQMMAQAGQGGGQQGQGQNQSSSPAQDSSNLQGKGPGNVDPKKLGERTEWGNLDPKEQQETLHRLSQQLPAHYREVVEEYFRKLARDGGD